MNEPIKGSESTVWFFSHHSWLNINYWNLEMLVWRRGRKPEHPEKAFWSKGQNQKQTQPTWNQATVGILLHVPIQYHPYTPFMIILPVSYFYFSFWLVLLDWFPLGFLAIIF